MAVSSHDWKPSIAYTDHHVKHMTAPIFSRQPIELRQRRFTIKTGSWIGCVHQEFLSLKVAEHSFGSLWVYVICRIMARERLQLTSWNLASEKHTDERFWLTLVKCDIFIVSMATWTIEYNLKISLLPRLHKIRSLDFPMNLHTAHYN